MQEHAGRLPTTLQIELGPQGDGGPQGFPFGSFSGGPKIMVYENF